MLAKKAPASVVVVPRPRTSGTPLEDLYARHMAIDSVIETLEDYDRYRARRLDERKRKSA
jgi:hypothetical protein